MSSIKRPKIVFEYHPYKAKTTFSQTRLPTASVKQQEKSASAPPSPPPPSRPLCRGEIINDWVEPGQPGHDRLSDYFSPEEETQMIDMMPWLIVNTGSSNGYFHQDYGCRFTCDPLLKHYKLTIHDMYNFADPRFGKQPHDAATIRAAFAKGPFHDRQSWPVAHRHLNEPRLRTLDDIDFDFLASLVRLFDVPLHAKPFEDEKGFQAKKKIVDVEVASYERRLEMLYAAQGGAGWHMFRAGGWGSSSKATIIPDMDHFTSVMMLFDSDTGKRTRDIEFQKSLYPRFYGNWVEDSNSWKQSYILGIFILEVGTVPHPKFPYFKSSPDRLVLIPPWIRWFNVFRNRKLPLRCMQEDKGPLFGKYTNRFSGPITSKQAMDHAQLLAKWPYPHLLPICYVPQQLEQMTVFDANLNLFSVDWQYNDLMPMLRVAGTDLFLVSAAFVLGVEQNMPLNDALYDSYNAYVRTVMNENGQALPPYVDWSSIPNVPEAHARLEKTMKTSPLSMIPVNQVYYFISGVAPTSSPIDWFSSHAKEHKTIIEAPNIVLSHHENKSFPTFSCPCCKSMAPHLIRGKINWNAMRWVQRRLCDPNVGKRPMHWKPDWIWPPYMGIALEFFPDAQATPITIEELGCM